MSEQHTPPGGGKLSGDRNFRPVRIAVLAVSDTRTYDTDTSAALLCARIKADGHTLAARALVKDDVAAIRSQLTLWIEDPGIEAVITTGGTGISGRDVTPEAVRPLFDKEIDGFQTIWHMVSYQSVGLSTMQSRACAGTAGSTFIFCLPGSTSACADGWDKLIRWQLDYRHLPCNMVEMMPRLMER